MLNKIRKLREKKGFTLVELIVVIAIIAILTAVIVPLVGRYSAQATYTTLQQAAKNIHTSETNVISDVTMMGTIYEKRVIIGKRSSGKLIVEVWSTKDTPAKLLASCKEANKGTVIDKDEGTDDDKKVTEKVFEALADALPNDCNFASLVGTNSVKGTIYTTATTSFAADDIKGFNAETSITNDTNFNDAFMIKAKLGSVAKDTKVGVAGAFIPPISTTTTAAPNPNS